MTPKIYKPTKKPKSTADVTKLCKEDGLLYAKGGVCIVRGGRIKMIFVGKDALKNAKKQFNIK